MRSRQNAKSANGDIGVPRGKVRLRRTRPLKRPEGRVERLKHHFGGRVSEEEHMPSKYFITDGFANGRIEVGRYWDGECIEAFGVIRSAG